MSSRGRGRSGSLPVSFRPSSVPAGREQPSAISLAEQLVESRAATAAVVGGGSSVLRSRVSANFRQALAEAKERSARNSRSTQGHQRDDAILFEEDDIHSNDGDSEGDNFSVKAKLSAPHVEISDPAKRRALRRWALIRDIIADIRRERRARQAEGWNMFFKHVRAMTEAEKTRQDLYNRYNIFGDNRSDFMSSLPVIPESLLRSAGLPVPTSRSRRGGSRSAPRPGRFGMRRF